MLACACCVCVCACVCVRVCVRDKEREREKERADKEDRGGRECEWRPDGLRKRGGGK